MADKLVPLTATEEGYLSHVLAGHVAAVGKADAKRAELVDVLLKDKGIPAGTLVRTRARAGDAPAYLIYAVPDAPKKPTQPKKSSASRRRRPR